MTRLFCLTLIVPLASNVPIHAQPKNDPPKNFTNSIGMRFVWIPPGTFMMGSPMEEEGASFNNIVDESQHKVTLTKGFYMGIHLVTQEQWQAAIPSDDLWDNPWQSTGEKRPNNDKRLPVEYASWSDCQDYIKALRKKDKKPYRLPTEAEWEYACRAGTTTPFHFGNTISTDQANFNGNYAYGIGKKGVHRNKITPVGSFPANACGLYDMHGNLWQWCQDRYGVYPQKAVVDPLGPEKGSVRVLRGGSYQERPDDCRSANRSFMSDCSSVGCGFRLCFFVE